MANSKKKCKHCKEYFHASDMHIIPAGTFCTREHGEEFVIARLNEKITKKKAKEKAKNDEWKASLPKNTRELNRKDIRWQEPKTQRSFNRMRVLQEMAWFAERGIEPYCISCGKEKMDFCCGHLQTRGSNSRLQFDERNTFLQCNKYCNSSLSGNIHGNSRTRGYHKGLLKRFGKIEGQAIIDYCETNNAPVKRKWWELEDLRKEFNLKIKQLGGAQQ